MLKFAAVILLLHSGLVLADFKSDIIASCTDYQQGIDKRAMNPCKLYIDGFIDSSLLLENAVIKPKAMIEHESEQQSDFVKRAYQSRVHSSYSTELTEKLYQFCIPLEYNRKQVVSTVAKSLNIKQVMNKPLKFVVFESLVANYPC